MLNKEIIIINTSAPLRNYMKRRPTHYAEILSQTNKVYNISSAPLKYYFKLKNKCLWEEIIYFRLPGNRFEIIKKLNDFLYRIFLNRFIKILPQKPILWNFFSGNFDIIQSLPNKICILEICDDTPEFFSNNPTKYNEVKKNENKMTEMSDVVFTISDYLKNKKISIRPDIYVIRNGVDFEDFAATPNLLKNADDELYKIDPPVVGYMGAVSNWFDVNLIEKIANTLSNVNFVFIGRIAPELQLTLKRLNKISNIHFIGEKPYNRLPHYLKYFDIAQIPFIMNELVASVNPIKLYEYLAAGKRVISTPLPEVLHHQKDHIIEVAYNVDEYAQAMNKMLAEKAQNYYDPCQNIARKNTWQARVELSCKVIEDKLNNPCQ